MFSIYKTDSHNNIILLYMYALGLNNSERPPRARAMKLLTHIKRIHIPTVKFAGLQFSCVPEASPGVLAPENV